MEISLNLSRLLNFFKFVACLLMIECLFYGYVDAQEQREVSNSLAIETEADHDSRLISELVTQLSDRKEIAPLLDESIEFVYHADNRCNGSTDGDILKLPASQVDRPFKIRVINDGDGWACDKKAESTYFVEFDLWMMLKKWDRIESGQYDSENRYVYIHGGGESEYLIFYFKKKSDETVINRIEYRSEDPG